MMAKKSNKQEEDDMNDEESILKPGVQVFAHEESNTLFYIEEPLGYPFFLEGKTREDIIENSYHLQRLLTASMFDYANSIDEFEDITYLYQ